MTPPRPIRRAGRAFHKASSAPRAGYREYARYRAKATREIPIVILGPL
jgi:hypothetical protein